MRFFARARSTSSLVAGALLLASSMVSFTATAAPAYNAEHPVLAYYYAWWDPQNFSRGIYQPPQPYNSDDPAVIQRHINQAQSAGIDGFIMSWYGIGDRTDKNLEKLLELGRATDFRTTVHVEVPLMDRFGGANDVIEQLTAFYDQRINHPMLVQYQGRPVIFFWATDTYDNATWSRIRDAVDPEHRAVWIADGDNFNVLRSDAWDGINPYAIAWSANPASQLPSWAAKARSVAPEKLWIPVVSPGCNDSPARSATCVRDRGDGSYYEATLRGALASNPSWAVTVSTFNEWLESTQIEPSVQYGDQYLQQTRAFANVFKGTDMAMQPIEEE